MRVVRPSVRLAEKVGARLGGRQILFAALPLSASRRQERRRKKSSGANGVAA